ncbi:hypothetical protein ACFS7Z_00885 [Pontibacter toksunensis]|uniref:Por secretion system C-terminal sorting domain-containing protein n=1 Tax=Pontibacter toksunensis TaxID=1332631 RepID=A0ABW6BQ55_9BACT
MMMKQKYVFALATLLPLAATLSFSTIAQNTNKVLPAQHKQHVQLGSENDFDTNYETLSGINLQYIGKGNYQLDFSQKLNEDAILSIKNTAQKVVYKKPVNVNNKTSSWRYKLGKLKPGTYLVEVATSDTTYWTKFEIGR